MKKVGLVLTSTLVLAGSIAVPAALGSASVGPKVTVEIKTLTKTLRTTTARGKKGWITKGGTPSGKCSASSAAGALDAATHGRWTATYYAQYGELFVDSILGVKPSGSDYWAIYVNGKFAKVGACDIKLHAGQRLLFQIKK